MTMLEIEAFLSICRYKSISKAADALYISQSSLSTRLKTLEEALDCQLLLRGKGRREISLTAQGQAFHDLALQYQQVLQKMKTVGEQDVVETLRISAINSVGNYLMPPVFQRFLQEFPHIRLCVQDMDAELACASIIRGKTDLAFSTAKVQTDQIVATPFLSEPMTLICSADSLYSQAVPPEILSLKNEVYIPWCADYIYWHESTFGADSRPQITLELIGQIGHFVSQPQKWALVPQSVARSLEHNTAIRQCSPSFSVPDRMVYILRDRDHAETNSIRCFLTTLSEVLSEVNTAGLML